MIGLLTVKPLTVRVVFSFKLTASINHLLGCNSILQIVFKELKSTANQDRILVKFSCLEDYLSLFYSCFIV